MGPSIECQPLVPKLDVELWLNCDFSWVSAWNQPPLLTWMHCFNQRLTSCMLASILWAQSPSRGMGSSFNGGLGFAFRCEWWRLFLFSLENDYSGDILNADWAKKQNDPFFLLSEQGVLGGQRPKMEGQNLQQNVFFPLRNVAERIIKRKTIYIDMTWKMEKSQTHDHFFLGPSCIQV